ncbi:Major centromere autoantigen B like protein [Argiope bruennichi]|uniref:Major centromere autoantigen B like protein n=1 Tax=Argiope bruennichi TaxID=94029 RepID=A0A8T0EPM9_ARGBR|nr:Major centromere autoantigen B like protein [Argiope bruennichi]
MGDEIVTPDNQLDIEDNKAEEQDNNSNSASAYDPVAGDNPGDYIEMPVVHKRKALTLKQKADIIAAYDENPFISKVELARRFNLSRTTLHSIVAKRDAISESMKKFGSYSSMRKKSRTSPFQEIEGKLLLWMEYAKDLNLPVNGFTLRRQAMAIAKDLGFEKFTASNGWIERFKSRHNDYWKACKILGGGKKVNGENAIGLGLISGLDAFFPY